jgi:hypothetical protein
MLKQPDNQKASKPAAAFTAFYDANVLYPAELRNLLMHLALTGFFGLLGFVE